MHFSGKNAWRRGFRALPWQQRLDSMPPEITE
jgi:hypothetical protein